MTHEYLSEWRGTSHVQISLDITGSSLDECSSTGPISGNDDLISDMVSQHILVAGKDVNGLDVEVQKVGSPRGGVSICESKFSLRNLRLLVKPTNRSVNGQREINPETHGSHKWLACS